MLTQCHLRIQGVCGPTSCASKDFVGQGCEPKRRQDKISELGVWLEQNFLMDLVVIVSFALGVL